MNRKLVLIGMSGAGKTTIGKLVSDKLKLSFVDLDEYISNVKSFDISSITNVNCLKQFRKLEAVSLREIDEYDVVSVGGGTILADGIEEFLGGKISIYLSVPVEVIEDRIKNNRPLLKTNSLTDLYKERKELYKSLSTHEVSNLDLEYAVNKIIKIINSEGQK